METNNTPPTVNEVKLALAATISGIGLLEHTKPELFNSDITLFTPGDTGFVKANFQIRVNEHGIFYRYGGDEETFTHFETKLKEQYPEATRTK